jgi:hypothetical protein
MASTRCVVELEDLLEWRALGKNIAYVSGVINVARRKDGTKATGIRTYNSVIDQVQGINLFSFSFLECDSAFRFHIKCKARIDFGNFLDDVEPVPERVVRDEVGVLGLTCVKQNMNLSLP